MSRNLAPVEFTVASADEEDYISHLMHDSDYDGPEIVWVNGTQGLLLDVMPDQVEELTVWLAGSCGLNFTSFTYMGEDLLSKYSAAIAAERS